MAEALEPETRLRARLVAVATAVLVLSGGGVVLDHVVGPKQAAAGAPRGGPSGAWFCPHGGGPNFRAWVVIANPGPSPVRIRLSDIRTGERPASLTLAPGHQAYREVPATDPADATEVEYFGGWVGV